MSLLATSSSTIMQALEKNTVAAGMRIERKPLFLPIFYPFLDLFYFTLSESITKFFAANKRFFSSIVNCK
jgi:hypothetical protein